MCKKIVVKKGNIIKKISIESLMQTRSSSKKENAMEVVETRSMKSKKEVTEHPKENLIVKGKKISFGECQHCK